MEWCSPRLKATSALHRALKWAGTRPCSRPRQLGRWPTCESTSYGPVMMVLVAERYVGVVREGSVFYKTHSPLFTSAMVSSCRQRWCEPTQVSASRGGGGSASGGGTRQPLLLVFAAADVSVSRGGRPWVAEKQKKKGEGGNQEEEKSRRLWERRREREGRGDKEFV